MAKVVIISRNPQSYLCGHSIFAWQYASYLHSNTRVRVIHITHSPDESRVHDVSIAPSLPDNRYALRIASQMEHEKLPRAMSSCAVADELADALKSDNHETLGVVFVSPLNFIADVLNLPEMRNVPSICLLRGTDTHLLRSPWRFSPSGRRYREAVASCSRVFAVSEYLAGVASQNGLTVHGIVPPTSYCPQVENTTLPESLLSLVGYGRPVLVFAGRFSLEKGVLQVAGACRDFLSADHKAVAVFAGSGELTEELRRVLAGFIADGRAWVGSLSFPQVCVLTGRADLCLMGSGLEPDVASEFVEAISSVAVIFASRGVPILYKAGARSGGIEEAVSVANRHWCAGTTSIGDWPASIAQILADEPYRASIGRSNAQFASKFASECVFSLLPPFVTDQIGHRGMAKNF